MPGQIIKRGERTWLVRVYLGRDAAGRRIYENKTIHGTKRDAEAWLAEALRRRDLAEADVAARRLAAKLKTLVDGLAAAEPDRRVRAVAELLEGFTGNASCDRPGETGAGAEGDCAPPEALQPIAGKLTVVKLANGDCGVYFLCRGHRVLYVGQSTNVASRIGAHAGAGLAFERAYVLPAPRECLDALEGAFIRALRPPHNRAGIREDCLTGAAARAVAKLLEGEEPNASPQLPKSSTKSVGNCRSIARK